MTWEMNLNKTEYKTTDTAVRKQNSNTYAFFTRLDGGYERSTFIAYVESTDNSCRSRGAEVNNTGRSDYINYNGSFINKDYQTHAILGATSYYSSYTVRANTQP